MDMKEKISSIMAFRMKHVDLARNKPKKFKQKIEDEFSDFNKQYPNILRLCIEGFFDNPNAINQLETFINLSDKVNKGEVDEKEASVAIGTKLVDQYVKPLINDDQPNDDQANDKLDDK
tara:strand:+ start:438 stop:794 length:357 start_codon:yes stop_codon:yes gene_type:complete